MSPTIYAALRRIRCAQDSRYDLCDCSEDIQRISHEGPTFKEAREVMHYSHRPARRTNSEVGDIPPPEGSSCERQLVLETLLTYLLASFLSERLWGR